MMLIRYAVRTGSCAGRRENSTNTQAKLRSTSGCRCFGRLQAEPNLQVVLCVVTRCDGATLYQAPTTRLFVRWLPAVPGRGGISSPLWRLWAASFCHRWKTFRGGLRLKWECAPRPGKVRSVRKACIFVGLKFGRRRIPDSEDCFRQRPPYPTPSPWGEFATAAAPFFLHSGRRRTP